MSLAVNQQQLEEQKDEQFFEAEPPAGTLVYTSTFTLAFWEKPIFFGPTPIET